MTWLMITCLNKIKQTFYIFKFFFIFPLKFFFSALIFSHHYKTLTYSGYKDFSLASPWAFFSITLKAISWLFKSNDSLKLSSFSSGAISTFIGCSRKINFSLNVLLWPFSFGHSLIMLAISCHFMKFPVNRQIHVFSYSWNIDAEILWGKRFGSNRKTEYEKNWNVTPVSSHQKI